MLTTHSVGFRHSAINCHTKVLCAIFRTRLLVQNDDGTCYLQHMERFANLKHIGLPIYYGHYYFDFEELTIH